MKKLVTVDYETEAIEPRPYYPPKPVSMAYKIGNKPSKFIAWGHPTENNGTATQAYVLLKKWWEDKNTTLIFHNAKFELEVTNKFFGLSILPAERYEDTVVLGYLHDPRERTLKLKELADTYLDMPPEEQEELRDWIIENVPEARRAKEQWGKYISKAPAKLVGKYAKGDTDRTYLLYELFHPYIIDQGMGEANEVEKELNPIILEMENKGILINQRRIKRDLKKYEKLLVEIEREATEMLGGININSGKQLAPALLEYGYAETLPLTKKGNYRTSRDVLEEYITNERLKSLLKDHSKLSKVLSGYMRKWAEVKDGIFYPWFSSTRNDQRGGTKTGRFSSNFQQVPKEPEESDNLPYLRDYIIAPPGYVLLKRDFSQQELRILAHIEGEDILNLYQENPHLDLHDVVKDMITQASGTEYSRSYVKTINFGTVYGMGVSALCRRLSIPYKEAQILKRQHSRALPGINKVNKELKRTALNGEPIYTHGGREYYAEEGFEYKQLNTYIQGSAADHTKRAMIKVHNAIVTYGARILIQVHDELIVLAREDNWRQVDKVFKKAMEFKYFDLLTPSDGSVGKSWGQMKPV